MTAYQVTLPQIAANTYSFSCSAKTDIGTFGFRFRWNVPASRWSVFVTLPSGEIRGLGLYPKIIAWQTFTDYGIYVSTALAAIGQNDLSQLALYITVK